MRTRRMMGLLSATLGLGACSSVPATPPEPSSTAGTEPDSTTATSASTPGTQTSGSADATDSAATDTGSSSDGSMDSSTTAPPPSGPRMLEPFQAIPTVNAADIEAFEVDGVAHLAIAHYYDTTTFQLDSKIYRWDGRAFIEHQSIPTSGAYSFEFFTVGDESWLGVANYYDDTSFDIDSVLYRHDGRQFVEQQLIATQGAFDLEAFMLGSERWLAVANEVSISTGELQYGQNSRLYRYEGGSFVPFQAIATDGAHDIEYFRVGTDDFLGIAQYYVDGLPTPDSYRPPARLLRWHSSEVGFSELTSVPSNAAFDWESFELDGQAYLMLANSFDGATFDVDSVLYRLEGEALVDVQHIATHDATAARHFRVDNVDYLAIANAATGDNVSSDYEIDSIVYRWEDGQFVEHQALPTQGAYDMEYFAIGDRHFLAVANSTDGRTVLLDSMIYELISR